MKKSFNIYYIALSCIMTPFISHAKHDSVTAMVTDAQKTGLQKGVSAAKVTEKKYSTLAQINQKNNSFLHDISDMHTKLQTLKTASDEVAELPQKNSFDGKTNAAFKRYNSVAQYHYKSAQQMLKKIQHSIEKLNDLLQQYKVSTKEDLNETVQHFHKTMAAAAEQDKTNTDNETAEQLKQSLDAIKRKRGELGELAPAPKKAPKKAHKTMSKNRLFKMSTKTTDLD